MIGFGIVAGIRQSRVEEHMVERLIEQRHKSVDVDTGSTPGDAGQDEMRGTVGGEFQLGKTPVNDGSFAITAATTSVVKAGVAADKTAGIESGPFDLSLAFVVTSERDRE